MKTLLLNANAMSIPLADKSVHCCVTSPPYWGLRDYGTASWEGGDAECDHKIDNSNRQLTSTLGGSKRNVGNALAGYKNVCGKCGAVRVDNQLGLEQTPEAYVTNMVAVFREVRRVLRDDGTLWLNLGDSYAGSIALTTNAKALKGKQGTNAGTIGSISNDRDWGILKPKDLVGIPWRVAFALQADGWWLRSDIIWSKPNPMPESVRDRPTKSHEYVFLLTKSARYYFDQDAVREENSPTSNTGGQYRNEWKYAEIKNTNKSGMRVGVPIPRNGRNIRSVWTIATAPYAGAHFAAYPPKLIEPCIKAGCPEGGVVLDPFAGSGTTLLVARNLGRNGIGLDLSYKYLHDNARERLGYTALDEWNNGKQDTTHDFGPMFGCVA